IYLFKTIEKLPQATYLSLNGITYNFEELRQDEPFKLLRGSSNIYWGSPQSSRRSSGVSFKVIESEVNPDETYEDRERKIRDLNKYNIQTIKKNTEKLNNALKAIRNWPLARVCQEPTGDSVFDRE